MSRPIGDISQSIQYASYGSAKKDPSGQQSKTDQYVLQNGDTVSGLAYALQSNFGLNKSMDDIEKDIVTQMHQDPNNRAHTTLDPNKKSSWDQLYAGDQFDLGAFWRTETNPGSSGYQKSSSGTLGYENSTGYQAADQFLNNKNGASQDTTYTHEGELNIQNAVDFVSRFDQGHKGYLTTDEINSALGLKSGTQNTIAAITDGKGYNGNTSQISIHDATEALLAEDGLESKNGTADGTITAQERKDFANNLQAAGTDSDSFHTAYIAPLDKAATGDQNNPTEKLGQMIDADVKKDYP